MSDGEEPTPPQDGASEDPKRTSLDPGHRKYWRANLFLVACLLVVWFFVSCVLGIFLVEPLNKYFLGGFPLGFWIAQNGSIYVFILLILVYCLRMEAIDRKFDVHESEEEKK